MTIFNLDLVYGIVLAGALLHAVWNALIKRSTNTLFSAVNIAAVSGVMAAVILPWIEQPATASWPFILVSLVLQVIYMRLVAFVYQRYDMSLSYPVMRGTAPLIVAGVSVLFFQDVLGSGTLLGIATICLGILCIGFWRQKNASAGYHFLLPSWLTAMVIAGYTLVDGTGARLSGAPFSYTLWIFLLQGVVMVLLAQHGQSALLWPYLRAHWKQGLVGGFGSIVSYGTALWAMTLAPVAVIAALRETSILFGVLISGLFLSERLNTGRLLGAVVLVLGIVILRVSG
ncbi:DMT family transporter [Castellaniella sp.]|uniref:DMT family transporter n=1 Tax=Castellaniella sp. TaxID=1955812 RepID=UPI002AFDCC60|nr:DMT family transporter [Castellaniella sp.]